MSDYSVQDNRVEKRLPLLSHGFHQTQTVAEFSTKGQANIVCSLLNEVQLLRLQVDLLLKKLNLT